MSGAGPRQASRRAGVGPSGVDAERGVGELPGGRRGDGQRPHRVGASGERGRVGRCGVANAADGAASGAGPLRWHGGPASTLLVCYEDHAAHVAWRARRYAERQARGGLDRVAVLSLDAPMYGPAESLTGGAALYNARPQPLAGWYDVAAAARETGARLIVIDPAGEAFAGEHNNVSAVREFLRALRGLAAAHAAGRPGAPKTFSDCAIETALTLRLVFRVPLRHAEGFLRSVLSLMGVDLAAPDHTTLSRRS